jgi:hypothetical protein
MCIRHALSFTVVRTSMLLRGHSQRLRGSRYIGASTWRRGQGLIAMFMCDTNMFVVAMRAGADKCNSRGGPVLNIGRIRQISLPHCSMGRREGNNIVKYMKYLIS